MTTRQYARLVHDWIGGVGLDQAGQDPAVGRGDDDRLVVRRDPGRGVEDRGHQLLLGVELGIAPWDFAERDEARPRDSVDLILVRLAYIDDAGAYTKPFTIRWDIPWNANGELTEYICQENNKYLQRLTDDFGQPIFGKKQ